MAGQVPVETISPLCSRWPESRPDINMLRKTVVDHDRPVTVGTPRSFRSVHIRAEAVAGEDALRRLLYNGGFSRGRSCRVSALYP